MAAQVDLSQSPLVCRICLIAEPVKELIRPCRCYAHRKCLDRWRTLSPFPEALTRCEECHQEFGFVYKVDDSAECVDSTKYVVFVMLDVLFFLGVFAGLWLLFGFLGDLSFNRLLDGFLGCHYNSTVRSTIACVPFFDFLQHNMWTGRIWFWGFICLFAFLGVVGCCFFCCGRGNSYNNSRNYNNDSDCYWIFCGPSYYNNTYYGHPYGYWDMSDIFCLMWLTSSHHHHHHYHSDPCCNCTALCAGCSDCNTGGNCGGSSSDDNNSFLAIIAIIVLVLVAILVVCGIIFTVCITFLVVNKILKRHLHLMDRKKFVSRADVVNLDNSDEVSKAEQQKGGVYSQQYPINMEQNPLI
eukprot:TRINITY_DN2336_c0_g1_i1.p1 TRINITY_DN2336_c0_g1~~TRINITY_DN2336_c0_g1_i1.p1  ORF type:complete len:354 (-),score=15.12 TRINITY_DN2336_c0_g1_i1:68-1129(-)